MNSVGARAPCLWLALFSLSALRSEAGQLEAGVGVYYDPTGTARSGPISPGQHLFLTVRLESLQLSVGDGVTGVQFGLEIDPRLTLHNAFPNNDVFFPAQVAPNEWLLGLASCKQAPISQYTLMLLEVSIAPGTVDTSNLRVGVRDLTQFGERMGYTHCLDISHFSRFYDAGDVLLNPSTPSIMHFSSSPDLAVLGRQIQLGWGGLGSAILDGTPVAAIGELTYDASSTTTHLLELSSGGSTEQAQMTVDVITTPRVEHFTAVIVETQPVPKAQLRWEVTGANTTELPQSAGGEYEIGQDLVTVPNPPIWTLAASNEWGTTNAVATLEGQTETLPPLILSLTATPTAFGPNAPITVEWEIFNADSAELSPGPGSVDPLNGSTILMLNESTEIVLTAHNENGDVTRSIPVNLLAVRIDSFSADPSTVYGGFPTRLSWTVENADAASIEPGIGVVDPQSGFVDVTPTADGTIYTLTANNADYTRTATQTIGWQPPTASFVDAPTVAAPGEEFDLEVQIEGGLSATLLPFPGAITPESQVIPVSISQSTIFELHVQNLAGDTVVHHEVLVAPPLIELTVVAQDGGPWVGEPFTLHVHIEGANQATLEPGFGEIDPTGGDFEVTLNEPTTFSCTASNQFGSVTESLLVEPILLSAELSASTLEPYGGAQYLLTATIVGAESASLTPLGSIPVTGGTFAFTASTPTTHTLAAQRSDRTLTRTLTITPKVPDILRFEVLNPPVAAGHEFQIVVELAGASTAMLTPGGGAINPTGGTFNRTVSEPTTFQLTATNATGSRVQELLVEPIGLSVELTASTTTPFGGFPFTLTATLEDAVSATLEPGFGAIDPAGGTFEAAVSRPTTFVLTGSDGTIQVSDSVDINPQKPAATLSVSNATPFPDESVTLSVGVQGAMSATLEPGIGEIAPENGTFSVQVMTPTTFILSATNPAGTTQTSRVVTPRSPRFSINPSVSPNQILAGQSAELHWVADHFDELIIHPIEYSTTEWGAGSLSVSPLATTTYQFVATNAAGTTTRSVTLNVHSFIIESFAASATQVVAGTPVTLTWSVVGIADVELVGIGPQPMVGSLVVTPTQTVTYVLRATNAGVTSQRSLTIFVGQGDGPGIFLSTDPNQVPGPPLYPELFVSYSVWVVAKNLVGGISGYEMSVHTPPCDLILGAALNPPTSINVGGVGNYIVGLGTCFFQTDLALVHMQLLRVTAGCEQFPFSLGTATPSSFGGLPGYATCGGELIPFEIGPPLYVGGIVPLALELQVDALDDGNRLQWSVATTEATDLRIYRRVDGSAEQIVRTLAPDVREWLDEDVAGGRRFEYELAALIDGEEIRSARKVVERELPQLALRSRLLPNVPNPFNPSTQLRFFLARAGSASLTIHDLSGRRVWSQSTGSLPAGEHSLTWTGIDDAGRAVASGVYLVRLQGADGDDTQRIALLK